MPGVFRYSIDNILKELETVAKLRIPAIALFPQIDNALKDENGSQAIDENNGAHLGPKALTKFNAPVCRFDDYTGSDDEESKTVKARQKATMRRGR